MLSPRKLKSMPSGAPWCLEHLRAHSAATSICVLLVTIMIFNPTSAASSSPKTSTATAANNNETSSTSQINGQTSSLAPSAAKSADTKAPNNSNSKTNGGNSASGQQQASIVEQQQLEPTDLSSMYVQIPIAEPVDTGMHDGGQKQIVSGDSDSDSTGPADTKASTWTGPWPKKFQIGYIKQSDLHQVLIESLKGDPFAHLTNPSTAVGTKSSAGAPSPSPASPASTKTGGVKTGAPGGGLSSDSSALMSPQNQWPSNSGTIFAQIQRQQPQAQQMQLMAKNIYHNQQQPMSAHNFRELPKFMQQQQANRYQQMSSHFDQPRPFVNQQPTMLQNSMQNVFQQQQQQLLQQQQQQHQYQLVADGFPTSFKNQPVYTINNHLHQEQLDANSMQLLMPPQAQLGVQTRQQKPSDYYGSSWRPVTSDKSELPSFPATKGGSSLGQHQQQQLQFQSDYQALNDGFDDGFNSPSKDASSSAGSMNRHPMLNNYLATNNGKLSPAMVAKSSGSSSPASASTATSSLSAPTSGVKGQQPTKPAAPTTTTTTSDSGPTKSAQPPTAKGGGESSISSPVNRRRSQAGSSTPSSTTSSTTISPNDTQSSTAVPGGGDDSSSSTTSSSAERSSSSSSSSTTTTMSTTTASQDSETTEPDSEMIDSETTEPSTGDGTTTTTMSPQQESTTEAASAVAAAGAASTTSTASSMDSGAGAGSNQQPDGGEAEVVTQGIGQQARGTAGLPLLPVSDGNDSTIGSTQPPAQPQGSTATIARGNSREETTPTVGETRGEVEDDKKATLTMSDEALLDAVIRTGSDIAKSAKGAAMKSQQSQQRSASSSSTATTTTAASTGGSKKARSSERLVQTSGSKSSGRKSANKLITKKPAAAFSSKPMKQATDGGGVRGASSKVLSSARTGKSSSTRRSASSAKLAATNKSASLKATRMASAELLQRQQQPQLVSMTAAQAQSTAQTLASILLSRCLLSTNCAHLLDVCSTKQAAVPFGQQDNSDQAAAGNTLTGASSSLTSASATAIVSRNSTTSAAWSVPVGLVSSSIMSLAQALQADRVLSQFPQWREAIENIVDQEAQTGYTLLLPSNEAIERQAAASVESWLSNPELLGQIIDNHIVDSAETIEFGGARAQTRFIRSKGLQVNQHRDKMVTINGKRVVYANQAAPAGGRIHVIDGILDWSAGSQANLLDIMDTLKQCDKFDGFVTLAQGTGLTQVLKQDGPLTVFVPSNDALRKIPDDELEVIKNNSTALKEFLMYHVVNGSYFSQDLRDGQQLASILEMKSIQVGVRVDGCSRRLVEANTSPMWRPDIAAKNGVIHILDWYLSTKNNECFNQMSRATSANGATPSSISASASSSTQTTSSSNNLATSERLQQLASESGIGGYATRVAMPANHKPAAPTPTVAAAEGEHANLQQQQQSASATNSGTQKGTLSSAPAQSSSESALGGGASSETNNIFVSASPLAAGMDTSLRAAA